MTCWGENQAHTHTHHINSAHDKNRIHCAHRPGCRDRGSTCTRTKESTSTPAAAISVTRWRARAIPHASDAYLLPAAAGAEPPQPPGAPAQAHRGPTATSASEDDAAAAPEGEALEDDATPAVARRLAATPPRRSPTGPLRDSVRLRFLGCAGSAACPAGPELPVSSGGHASGGEPGCDTGDSGGSGGRIAIGSGGVRGESGERDARRGERDDPRLPGEPARGGVGGLAADGRTADVNGVVPPPPRADAADTRANAPGTGDTPGDVARPPAGATPPDISRPRRASSCAKSEHRSAGSSSAHPWASRKLRSASTSASVYARIPAARRPSWRTTLAYVASAGGKCVASATARTSSSYRRRARLRPCTATYAAAGRPTR